MKITVEIDNNFIEDEVVIRCKEWNENIAAIHKAITDSNNNDMKLELQRDGTNFYIRVSDILFLESSEDIVWAHTIDNRFFTKRKLYELENILPGYFIRISKSAILNTNKVYAITRNLTASSVIQFSNTTKQVYVSRSYYKSLINKLEEKRDKS